MKVGGKMDEIKILINYIEKTYLEISNAWTKDENR